MKTSLVPLDENKYRSGSPPSIKPYRSKSLFSTVGIRPSPTQTTTNTRSKDRPKSSSKTHNRLDSIMRLMVCKPQAESYVIKYKENHSKELKKQISKVQNER